MYEFDGNIELVNNTFSKNMAFVPSTILSNNEKFNKTLLNFNNDFFKEGEFLAFQKNETTYFNKFINFLNYFDP